MKKILDIKDIIKLFNTNAFGGGKTPHHISNPVFRMAEDGKYVVSVFIITYTADDIRKRMVKRPFKWMSMDIKSEYIITGYYCLDNDFCNVSFDVLCSLEPEINKKHSMEYINQTREIFNLIVRKYIETGEFDKVLNDKYMEMMLAMAPVGFKEFYKQMNNV